MPLFESILTLLLVAVVALQVSRYLRIPYPTMLAVAGVGVALLPSAPRLTMDPHLVMTLFIAPAILDAAFEFPPRAIRRYWLPLLSLAVIAVLLTTLAVAWVGVAFAGLPPAAAVVLGAIVAPPDAAAAAAMLDKPSLPRATVTVLKGESLLNDAVALLVFSVALHVSGAGAGDLRAVIPQLALAIPGGLLLGVATGRISVAVAPFLAGTFGGILFQFLATFGTWMLAERLHLSAILAVVAAAMTVARHVGTQPASDRLHSNVVWSLVVFVLNLLAFLFIGLQARSAVEELGAGELRHALGFALLVFVTVVLVRVVWVLFYNRLAQPLYRWLGYGPGPTLQQGIVAAWCGMRGMVTLAAALALPAAFPQRDLIVLSALAVVLGTLVLQGLTLEPLIRRLRFTPDGSYEEQLAQARAQLAAATESALQARAEPAARILLDALRADSDADRTSSHHPFGAIDTVRLQTLAAQRAALAQLRRDGRIDETAFRLLEQELDLSEVAAARRRPFGLAES